MLFSTPLIATRKQITMPDYTTNESNELESVDENAAIDLESGNNAQYETQALYNNSRHNLPQTARRDAIIASILLVASLLIMYQIGHLQAQ